MIRLMISALACVLAVVALPAFAQEPAAEPDPQHTWDLSELYASNEAWNEARDYASRWGFLPGRGSRPQRPRSGRGRPARKYLSLSFGVPLPAPRVVRVRDWPAKAAAARAWVCGLVVNAVPPCTKATGSASIGAIDIFM